MSRPEPVEPEARARRRLRDLTDLLWHAGVFVIVNGFLWVQDAVAGGGIDYAYWTTIPWGFGLLIHAITYFIRRSRFERRTYERFLEEEQAREPAQTI